MEVVTEAMEVAKETAAGTVQSCMRYEPHFEE
jgi:hypothetical protein